MSGDRSLVGSVLALLLVLSGCGVGLAPPEAPDVAAADRPPRQPSGDATTSPSGSVTVAQPNPVGTWWQQQPADLGAGDLAALWSLPMYRVDRLGRHVPALARDARVVATGAAWTIEVDLAPGSWSDGRPVTARDVVATAEVLAEARPAAWAAWTEATAVDDGTVRLSFDRPFAGWLHLLSEPPGVLPAHVLEGRGLDAYAEELPVTGGWFRLGGRERGRSMSFSAHPDTPLGAPAVESVEVLVVPSAETALGLLAEGRVDLVQGHVVLDPPARRRDVDGTVGESPFGGTRFELVWPGGGGTGGQRAAAAARLDPAPFVDGLLRQVGRRPGGLLPAHRRLPRPAAADADGAVSIQLTRTVEGLGLLARRLQADLQDGGVAAALVRLDPPEHLDPPVTTDAELRVVRVAPTRSMAALLAAVGLDPAPGLAADAAGVAPLDPMAADIEPPSPLQPVVDLLAADPRLLPVAEVAVTHVWHPDRISGVEPSAWPGVGFWNAGEWRVPRP